MNRTALSRRFATFVMLLACWVGGGPDSAANAQASSAPGAAAAGPSFDCAHATERVEKLICGDAELAALDREMNRLYQIAIEDGRSTPAGDALAATQDEWISGRNQCGADVDPKYCVVWDYAERVHRLRQGSKAAREAPGGVSAGPVAYRCDGMDALIGATFVNAGPNLVFLEWLDQSLALTQVPSGSGARYARKGQDGEYSLWTKGEEALFQKPGAQEMNCSEEVIG